MLLSRRHKKSTHSFTKVHWNVMRKLDFFSKTTFCSDNELKHFLIQLACFFFKRCILLHTISVLSYHECFEKFLIQIHKQVNENKIMLLQISFHYINTILFYSVRGNQHPKSNYILVSLIWVDDVVTGWLGSSIKDIGNFSDFWHPLPHVDIFYGICQQMSRNILTPPPPKCRILLWTAPVL